MTISLPVARGVQVPRLHSVPPHSEPHEDSPGALAVELAASAGLYLDPWQKLVLEQAMYERANGRWAAREVGCILPRQSGKGSVLEALELAGLFLPEPGGPPPLLLHSAHEYKTADEHFRRMRDLIEGSDRLRPQIRITRTASGAQSIELVSGARLRFVTRTSGSGRGFSADLVVIDEAYNLTDEAMAAVLPTLSARPNPQIWYTSSAGMPASTVLARVRARGMTGTDPNLAYFEWSAPDDADLDDREAWAQANPALGIRIPIEAIEGERAAMPDEQFGRERLGMWPDTSRHVVLDAGLWLSLADPTDKIKDPVCFAVDVTPDRSSASLAVAGWRADGKAHVQIVRNAPGTGWVQAVLERAVERSRPSAVLVDGAGPAASLVPQLSEVRIVNTREMGQACGAFYDAVAQGTLRHHDDLELNIAVAAAKKRNLGDAWAWTRKGSADISPLVAATLALHGLNSAPTTGGWMVSL